MRGKRQQILESSRLKEFADHNFKFDENGSKLSKQVESTVGKGEIARYEQFLLFPQCFQMACYEQFLLFPQCFQMACFPGASKGVIVWYGLTHSHTVVTSFDTSGKEDF